MDRTEMRRLTGRRLEPRRYWGPAIEETPIEEEVIIDGACPPSPIADEPVPARTQHASRASAACRQPVAPPLPTAGRTTRDRRREHARHLASLYAFGGAIIGAAPIPNPDMPLLVSIESRLVGDIARLYSPDGARAAQMRAMPLLGFGGYLLRGLSRRGHRRMPLLGWAVNGFIAYWGVRLVGELEMRWCEARRRVELLD